MKTVYFVRHAKSSWANYPAVDDIDRSLNKRGFRDAPFMASLVAGKGAVPDAIVSSPAVRAHTTAKYFAKEFNIAEEDIVIRPELYHAGHWQILEVVQSLSGDWGTVFVFGHNPGFTDVANLFSVHSIANVPTCGVVKVCAEVDNWANFIPDNGRVEAFHYPKQYFT